MSQTSFSIITYRRPLRDSVNASYGYHSLDGLHGHTYAGCRFAPMYYSLERCGILKV